MKTLKHYCWLVAVAVAVFSCTEKTAATTISDEPDPVPVPPQEDTIVDVKIVPHDTTFARWINTIKLSVVEPSSLCWSKAGNTFFVAGDNGAINEVRPSSGANKAIVFNQTGYDWEGLALDSEADVLYALAERGNKIYSLSGTGHKTCELFLDATIPGTQDGSDNYGCEGLEYHDGILYLGNQHNPCLIQRVNAETKEVIDNTTITFCKFISDLCYDDYDDSMWILESNATKEGGDGIAKIYNCTLPDCTLRCTLTLPYTDQAEGMEIDRKNGLIYICCDKTGNLYTLEYGFN